MKLVKWGVRFGRQHSFTLLLVAILLLAGLLRLYRLQAPLADWHSWRQADTASVTREYVKNGIDLLHPQYHDLSNIPSGEENPQGWRMVEFPLVNAFTAWLLRWHPQWDLVVTSRLLTVGSTVLALGFFVDVVRHFAGKKVALLSGFVWAVMPYAIYYGRVILPEPYMLLFVILTAWFLDRWLRQNNLAWLLATTLAAATALLIKPVAIFFVPWWLGMVLMRNPRQLGYRKWLLMFMAALVGVLPLLWWRQWILKFSAGIPASTWLLNGNGIRLRPAWWRWLFSDRLGRIMFGYWGAGLLLLGLLSTVPQNWRLLPAQKWWKQTIVFLQTWIQQSGALLGLTVGMLLYLTVFATGNVQHDYYQILLIPLVSWLAAAGILWVVDRCHSTVERYFAIKLLVILGLFSLAFSWYQVKDWFSIINPAIVEAGQAVDRLTEPDALIIAPYMGDTAFLFQTNRRGWPIGGEIEKRIQQGADYYVSTAYDDETNQLLNDQEVVLQNDQFVIIKLKSEQ